MSAPVFKIIKKTDSSKSWSVKDMLEDCINREEETPSERGLVLMLDLSGDNYEVGFANAGLSASEAIALLEVAKHRFLGMMGYSLTAYDRWDIE